MNTLVQNSTNDSFRDYNVSQLELAATSWQQSATTDDDSYVPLSASSLSLDISSTGDADDDDTVTSLLARSRIETTDTSWWWMKLWSGIPLPSVLLLNAVAIIWGTQHAVIKLVVDDSSVGSFTLLRFALAALLASPYTPGLPLLFQTMTTATALKEEELPDSMISATTTTSMLATTRTAWRWGVEMGFWMFLGFAFQAVGLEVCTFKRDRNFPKYSRLTGPSFVLQTTTAQRSGFLLYLNVKFVPFLARTLYGRKISVPTWISAFVAFFGTALLAIGGSSNASVGLALNTGDWWSIAAAAASAMFILRLESASVQVSSSAQLNAACLWTVALFSLLWSLGQAATFELWQEPASQQQLTILLHNLWYSWTSQLQHVATKHAGELAYLGGVTTAFANYVQTKAQKDVSAERASVIYAMDPVYGAFFSYLILGEILTGWSVVGAALIALAAATNAFVDFGGNKSQS
jgi:drug/metabolite transporter (DMT)-like permease